MFLCEGKNLSSEEKKLERMKHTFLGASRGILLALAQQFGVNDAMIIYPALYSGAAISFAEHEIKERSLQHTLEDATKLVEAYANEVMNPDKIEIENKGDEVIISIHGDVRYNEIFSQLDIECNKVCEIELSALLETLSAAFDIAPLELAPKKGLCKFKLTKIA